MAKLAKLAGVSVSTVSKAFSGSEEISEEKKEHIFRIAKEAGCYDKYCKNIYSKKVIAVICPEFQSRYYSEQLTIFEREINARGSTMIVSATEFDAKREEELLEFFSEYAKVDGIIIYSPTITGKKYSLPIAAIGKHDTFNSICLSHKRAICEAVEQLAENGHKAIAFIGEKNTRSKRTAFEYAMENAGIDVKAEYVTESEFRFEAAGYDGMNMLFNCQERPTAVLAAYDCIAIGAMKSIYEHGLKIPDDISIIGMDDIKETPYLSVPLTSITSYNDDLCQIVVDMLFDDMGGGGKNVTKHIKISTELVKRGSVGKVK